MSSTQITGARRPPGPEEPALVEALTDLLRATRRPAGYSPGVYLARVRARRALAASRRSD